MDTTQHDLKILAICYYIMAAISGASALFIGAYISFIGTFLMKLPLQGAKAQQVPEFIPGLMAAVGAVVIGLGILCTACNAGAAWSLPKRRNYPLVIIAAVVNCLNVPFGTALGVFTFVVLNRPGVKESFYMPYSVMPVAQAPPLPPRQW
jgi:hypothetical protein